MDENDDMQPDINAILTEAAIKTTLQEIKRKWRDTTGEDLDLEEVKKLRLGSLLEKLYPKGVRFNMAMYDMKSRAESIKHEGWARNTILPISTKKGL